MTLQRSSSSVPAYLSKAKLARAKNKTKLRQAQAMTERAWELRGHNATIQDDESEELLLCGPAGSGKTLSILIKINRLCWEYPELRVLIVRKVRADLAGSTLVTFERDVLGYHNPICAGVQRETRMVYRYPNGSEIVIGGMDRPGKVLSAEYDIIYVPEAVQMNLNDWETLLMRLRSGVMGYQQLIADTNPDRPDHWIKKRADQGLTKLLNTWHKDNPAYWDGVQWTKRGIDYVLGKLSRLSGVRKARYFENRWAVSEGVIYDEFNEDIHLIDAFDIPREWRKYRSIDLGYNNPFVCQWWAEDPDGRLYLYREIYHTQRLVSAHADEILRLTAGVDAERWQTMNTSERGEALRQGEQIDQTIADHDAEDRATLEHAGIESVPAIKSVKTGIEMTKERLRVLDDGRPRLYILRGACVETDQELDEAGKPTSTQDEIGGYVWKSRSQKDEPVKEDDHGVDAMRYMVMSIDEPNEGNTVTMRRGSARYNKSNRGRHGRY